MLSNRRRSKKIWIGAVPVGGGAPIAVQSMTNTDTRDSESTLRQIRALEMAGCEIVRVAVPDEEAVEKLPEIVRRARIPVIADVHFDYRLALDSLRAGVAGLRLNPGNIGGEDKIRRVVALARERAVPIRVGVNAGSLEKDILAHHGRPCAEAMVESALRHVRLLEEEDFDLIKVSLKSSDVMQTVAAYRLLAHKVPYPFHIGVTEAGTPIQGAIKSAVGLGLLLAEGLGDTLRVSITGDPEEEMTVAYGILRALGIRRRGVELVSCPTCGRTEIDLVRLAVDVERALRHVKTPIKVAVMGCVVNGPGEAREADVGVAGGRGVGILFKKGVVVEKLPQERLFSRLLREVESLTGERIEAESFGDDKE